MPAAAEESSAIRKLGRLFRLTEVHLWDDCASAAGETHSWRDVRDWLHSLQTSNLKTSNCPTVQGSQTAKTRNRPAKQTGEDHSFVEDMELASLMGSLGLPVSFSTRKEKKNNPVKGKHQGRQAPYEAANTPMNDDVRTCSNTEEIGNVPELMACVEHTNSCISSRTAVGTNEPYRADVDKVLGEDSAYVEKSACGTIYSDEIVPRDEAENQSELETSQFDDNMSIPAKSDSPVRENQAVDTVLQLNKVMLGQNSVDNESKMSCAEFCQEGELLAREYHISVETSSISNNNNDVECKVCPSPAEPSPVNSHVEKSGSDFYYEYGDWKVLWDQFYSRYYFYNILTQESTWYPPHGLEDFAPYCSMYTSQPLDERGLQYTNTLVQEHNESTTRFDQSSGVLTCVDNTADDCLSEVDQHVVQYGAHLSESDSGKVTFDQAGDHRHLDEQGRDLNNEVYNLSDIPDGELINLSVITTPDEAQHDESIQNDSSTTEVLEMNQEITITKNKKRVRRSQLYHSCQDLAENISSGIAKYWTQRYSLFSLFDSGIEMDEEGWFSVTPESIAKHHASRVGVGIVIDSFTGVGGNAIQFARTCKHVVAVDIDPQKISCAWHNTTVYGVHDHIDFIVSDFIHIAPHLKGETAFMSPPWGGPDYNKVDVYDIKAMLRPCDAYHLFKLATVMASRVVMFLPRNTDLNQLADMCFSVDRAWAVEVEKNYLNGKLKAITAYFEKQDGPDVQRW